MGKITPEDNTKEKSALYQYASKQGDAWVLLYLASYYNSIFEVVGLTVGTSLGKNTTLSTLISYLGLITAFDPFVAAYLDKPSPLMLATQGLYNLGKTINHSLRSESPDELKVFLDKNIPVIPTYTILSIATGILSTGLAGYLRNEHPTAATLSLLIALSNFLDPYVAACTKKPSPLMYASSFLHNSAKNLCGFFQPSQNKGEDHQTPSPEMPKLN